MVSLIAGQDPTAFITKEWADAWYAKIEEIQQFIRESKEYTDAAVQQLVLGDLNIDGITTINEAKEFTGFVTFSGGVQAQHVEALSFQADLMTALDVENGRTLRMVGAFTGAPPTSGSEFAVGDGIISLSTGELFVCTHADPGLTWGCATDVILAAVSTVLSGYDTHAQAQTRADNARNAAISTAADDATTKAANAQSAATTAAANALAAHVAAGNPHSQYVLTTALTAALALKADLTDVTTGLNGKADLIHAARHKSGGADPIKLNELAAPDASLNLAGQKVTGGSAGTSGTDLTTKQQMEDAIAAAISALVGGAGTMYDTMAELQAFLEGDASELAALVAEMATKVSKTLYDANTIVKADTDDTPVSMSVGLNTLVGRGSSGAIAALSVATVKAMLAITYTDVGAEAAGVAATLVSNHAGATTNVHGHVRQHVFSGIDTAEVKTYAGPLRLAKTGTLVGIALDATTAPVGSSLTVQLKKNGTNFGSAFSLTAGNLNAISGTLSNTYTAGDILTISFTAVGSTTAATGVSVMVLLKDD
jgi:hypothetical protein